MTSDVEDEIVLEFMGRDRDKYCLVSFPSYVNRIKFFLSLSGKTKARSNQNNISSMFD